MKKMAQTDQTLLNIQHNVAAFRTAKLSELEGYLMTEDSKETNKGSHTILFTSKWFLQQSHHWG